MTNVFKDIIKVLCNLKNLDSEVQGALNTFSDLKALSSDLKVLYGDLEDAIKILGELKAFYAEIQGLSADHSGGLKAFDNEIDKQIAQELQRQQSQLHLIASENFTSKAVMEAQGSVLTNKYAEGYSGKRYYCGCEYVDKVENIAVERLCKLFDVKFANVQPHSGSQANQAVFVSLLNPGDTILGLSLDSGGHLTHGAKPSLSGKWFNSVQYTVDEATYLLDMDSVEELALQHKPKLIIAGASAYPRKIDFQRFREIADKVNAYLLADIAHYAGLIASGEYPSPTQYAHVVTSTTHKTLRGPRGGIIMTNDETIYKKIQSSVFPGLQGGPLMHVIAAKAVAFKEALDPKFKVYSKKVIENARIFAQELQIYGLNIVSGGTDSHIVLVDLRPQKLTGKDVVDSLERAGIICNKNAIPFDTTKPTITSGLRFGTAAETTRGLEAEDFKKIASLINDIIYGLINGNSSYVEKTVLAQVKEMCRKFS